VNAGYSREECSARDLLRRHANTTKAPPATKPPSTGEPEATAHPPDAPTEAAAPSALRAPASRVVGAVFPASPPVAGDASIPVPAFALDTASLPASMGVKGAPASEAQPGIGVCVQPTTLLHSSEVQPSPSSQLPHEAHVAAPAPVA
jgi:hypothetical protein